MKLSITISAKLDATLRAYALRIQQDLLTTHRATPFANLDAVSDHLHRDRNPRMKVTTNEAGTRTEVHFRETLMMTIHG